MQEILRGQAGGRKLFGCLCTIRISQGLPSQCDNGYLLRRQRQQIEHPVASKLRGSDPVVCRREALLELNRPLPDAIGGVPLRMIENRKIVNSSNCSHPCRYRQVVRFEVHSRLMHLQRSPESPIVELLDRASEVMGEAEGSASRPDCLLERGNPECVTSGRSRQA